MVDAGGRTMKCECGHPKAMHIHGEHSCTRCGCARYRES